jgi:RimJ/RimL family protein N-acetyltransferase
LAIASLETARLVLEPLGPAHAAAHFPHLQDPELYRFTPGHKPPASVAELEQRYAAMASGREPEGTAVSFNWAARLREGGADVGTFGTYGAPGGRAVVMYTVFTAQQRRGYAREGLRRVIEHLRDSLRTSEVAAWIDPRNARSICLVEALGFARAGQPGSAHLASDEGGYVLRIPSLGGNPRLAQ